MSLRVQLADQLRVILPPSFRVIDSERSVETLSAATVYVRQRTIEPAAAAFLGARQVTFVVILAVPGSDLEKAEDELEERLEELLAALDATPYLTWSKAEKTLHEEKYLAYYIDLTTVTKKEDS